MSAQIEAARRLVEGYFAQLTKGCDKVICENPDCVSCPGFRHSIKSPDEAAKIALTLVKSGEAKLCKRVHCPNDAVAISKNFSDLMHQMIDGKFDKSREKEAEVIISKVFSSLDYFMNIFLTDDIPISKNNILPNDQFVDDVGNAIYENREFFEKFRNPFNKIVESIKKCELVTYHYVRLFFYLPAFKYFIEDESLFIYRLIDSQFPKEASDVLFNGLMLCPLISRIYVQLCHASLAAYLLAPEENSNITADPNIKGLQIFLKKLRVVSELSNDPIPTNQFYNDIFSEEFPEIINQNEFNLWDFIENGAAVINLEVKCGVLRAIMSNKQNQILRQNLLSQILDIGGIDPNQLQLTIEVRRSHLLEDTLSQLSLINKDSVSRRLLVKFAGEDGIDVGGVSREFFYLITAELFNPDHGMFNLINNQFYWFNRATIESPRLFNLLGTIIGLAIYNGILLPIRFPVVLYKKLLSMTLTLSDLKEIDRSVYDSIQNLIKMRDDGIDISESGITFEGSYLKFDQLVTEELIEGGANIYIDNKNLDHYIQSYISWSLGSSIDKYFSAFKRGYDKLCNDKIFEIFTADELQIIVSGEEKYDWDALKYGTKYIDGYKEDSQAINWFWEVFNELTEKQKIDFLLFSTGSDKAPVGGLAQTNLLIQRSGDSEMLPVAHTCFSIFSLPDYPTKKMLKEKMLIALNHIEGFGLK